MTKKNWLLLIVLLALGSVYVCYFTNWFKPRLIQIHSTSRSIRRHRGADSDTMPVLFMLNTKYELTELSVVPLAAWQTNRNVLPVWHLVSDSNSVPLKTFGYGQYIKGMKPALAGVPADPLQPDVTYHLILKAGTAKGEHDFEAKPAEQTDSTQ